MTSSLSIKQWCMQREVWCSTPAEHNKNIFNTKASAHVHVVMSVFFAASVKRVVLQHVITVMHSVLFLPQNAPKYVLPGPIEEV